MKILLITDSYPPEVRSASHLMQELAIGLKSRNFEVFVATTYPEYNLSEEYKNKTYDEFTEEDGIKILRIKTLPHHNVNFILRGIAQISMPYIFISKIRQYIKKIDIIIVYSPPLTLATLGSKLKKIYQSKFLLNVQDIFPQNAIDLGILKNKFLIKMFKIIERKAYENADIIFVHSENNLEFLKSQHSELKNKFLVLHNWIDVKEFEGIEATKKYRELYSLESKFILLFAGVLGPSQGLDFVVNLAERIKDIEEIAFLFVGDGMEKQNLEKMIKEKNLKNAVFKPFVSKSEYPYLVKDCDVGLVSLTNKNKTPVVPGKILGYMAAGLPILAFLNKESDGHHIIKKAQCGFTCINGDLNEAEHLLRKMYSERNKLKEMGFNGYRYVSANYDKDIIINNLLQYF